MRGKREGLRRGGGIEERRREWDGWRQDGGEEEGEERCRRKDEKRDRKERGVTGRKKPHTCNTRPERGLITRIFLSLLVVANRLPSRLQERE